jgi:hypothetical protein
MPGDNPYFLLAFLVTITFAIGAVTRRFLGSPVGPDEAERRRTLGVDPRVTLGEKGFTFDDPNTPLDYEVHCRVRTRNPAPEQRMFLLTSHKVWVHTQHRPFGVEIVAIRKPDAYEARGTLAELPQARRIGGHRSRVPRPPVEVIDNQLAQSNKDLVDVDSSTEDRVTPVQTIAPPPRRGQDGLPATASPPISPPTHSDP